ncbi:TPA: hypothetical protein N0F65_010110, partial [Lagenidium giganteum]
QQQSQAAKEGTRAFSTYSFSNSSIVDDHGRRAVHERQIEGKKMKTIWNRANPDDSGRHETICSDATPEEFEKAWQATPFGKAQHKTLEDQSEHKQPPPQPQAQDEKPQQIAAKK